jgi:DNA-binding LacI/PurR family transcriptional regulator
MLLSGRNRFLQDRGSGRRWHIFAITDLVAVGVLSYFNDNKIKVPQQVAVIGFAIGLCRKYLLQN